MEATQYLKNLALIAGVPADNEHLTELLANESLQQITINDQLANQINGSILTMESAKHNSELSRHFKATILNGLDNEVTKTLEALELPDEIKREILSEQSTFKRVPLLVSKVKELEAAKAGASKSDKNDLQKEIDRLNGQISEITNSHNQALKAERDSWKNKFLDTNISTVLHGYDYAIETNKSNSVMMAKALINAQLQSKGIKVVSDDQTGELKLQKPTDDGSFMDYFENNQKVGFKDFVDKTLTENNLLKTNNSGGAPTPTPTPPTPSGKRDAFADAVERQIAELNQ